MLSDQQFFEREGIVMERRLSSMTQMEIAKIIGERKPVILPTGATEAHGPHMPTDTDTYQAEYIALKLAERIDAVVAPPVAYGISKTFEFFPGTCEQAIEKDFVLLEVPPLDWDRRSEIDRFIGPLTPNESRLQGSAAHPNPIP
jgi:Creatinine amidohydrolase